MSDIFISFDSDDLERIKPLATALETKGWSVFYDRTIPPGKTWREVIDKEINECRCMVVGWSKNAIKSHWVLEEADDGLTRNILVPFLLDDVDPPRGFRAIQAGDLVDWQGDQQSLGFLALSKSITGLIGAGKAQKPVVVENKAPGKLQNQQSQASEKSDNKKQPKKNNGQDTSVTQNLPTNKTQYDKKVVFLMIAIIAVFGVFFMTGSMETIRKPDTLKNSLNEASDNTVESIKIEETKLTGKTQTHVKKPEMVIIPAGTFQMGSNNGAQDEQPVHTVTINRFAMSRHEVTFEEYDNYAKQASVDKPKSSWGRGKQPVIRVSWDDAVGYAEWISKQTGKQYRLPTEAEWEYAARAGTNTDYYWEEGNIKEYAWFNENSNDKTHTVGGKLPNSFGLYDMSGNVWEWVQDCWHKNYKKAPDDGSAWEQGDGGNCPLRVLRGGSWFLKPYFLRSAYRNRDDPDGRNGRIGFRLAQDLP